MNPATKQEWEAVHQSACDIVNALGMEDEVLAAHHTQCFFDSLDALDCPYGPSASLIATRADFTDDLNERRRLYEYALGLARRDDDEFEENEILQSLAELDQDQRDDD